MHLWSCTISSCCRVLSASSTSSSRSPHPPRFSFSFLSLYLALRPLSSNLLRSIHFAHHLHPTCPVEDGPPRSCSFLTFFARGQAHSHPHLSPRLASPHPHPLLHPLLLCVMTIFRQGGVISLVCVNGTLCVCVCERAAELFC